MTDTRLEILYLSILSPHLEFFKYSKQFKILSIQSLHNYSIEYISVQSIKSEFKMIKITTMPWPLMFGPTIYIDMMKHGFDAERSSEHCQH